ncbi:MAG: DUF1343 domain-containing protein [Flavobacteriales bacterium]|nr:DUF1343 domain-containing protein [Flavobacteriales bacterium]
MNQFYCFRPNPNGFYVAGPVLDLEFQSFVGMHPIPVVHGCTVGELAKMIVGEGWLDTNQPLDLKVIPCKGYTHSSFYELPIAPSPNLPNMSSVYLYPSLCFFEATSVSIGRGTNLPFQVIGYPESPMGSTSFTPQEISGVASSPKHEGVECRGLDVSAYGEFIVKSQPQLHLHWLLQMQKNLGDGFINRPDFFDLLAGNSSLRESIAVANNEEELRKMWEEELLLYKTYRKKYLLYPDFE